MRSDQSYAPRNANDAGPNPKDAFRRVRVHRDEITGRNGMMRVSIKVLERIASHSDIGIPPKILRRASGRAENDRVWEKIRSDVEAAWIAAWPARESIELPSKQDQATGPW